MSRPTAERVRSLLSYDPSSGAFTWKARPESDFAIIQTWKLWVAQFEGRRAGAVKKDGYRVIRVDGRLHYAHRLAWLIVHGEWPAEVIDHIDGDRGNNSIVNLRAVSIAENLRNSALSKTNKSGVSGVSQTAGGKWAVMMCVAGKRIYLGVHSTVEDAAIIARNARAANGFHPNHGRPRGAIPITPGGITLQVTGEVR